MELSNQPFVVDCGTGLIKAGFAGDEAPNLVCPTYTGRPKHVKVMASAQAGNIFVGNKAKELRGLLKLNHPMKHGVINDWKDMQVIWDHMYRDLKVAQDQHPILLTEAPLNPNSNRKKLAEVFFESYNVPALYIQMSAILSLYASGRTTGVVLDSGEGVTSAVPVYQGFAVPHAVQRIDVAGREVTDYLQLLLRKAGHPFHTSAEKEIIRDIKEKNCFVAYTPDHQEQEQEDEQPYKLPDGEIIQTGQERFRAPEVLFNPSLIGLEYPGIHHVLVNSIAKCDLDMRRELFWYILLAGGSTLYTGLGDRLCKEVKVLAPRSTKIKIYAPSKRVYSTWIGGSILASLTAFQHMWVTQREYQEAGPSIIHRRMF